MKKIIAILAIVSSVHASETGYLESLFSVGKSNLLNGSMEIQRDGFGEFVEVESPKVVTEQNGYLILEDKREYAALKMMETRRVDEYEYDLGRIKKWLDRTKAKCDAGDASCNTRILRTLTSESVGMLSKNKLMVEFERTNTKIFKLENANLVYDKSNGYARWLENVDPSLNLSIVQKELISSSGELSRAYKENVNFGGFPEESLELNGLLALEHLEGRVTGLEILETAKNYKFNNKEKYREDLENIKKLSSTNQGTGFEKVSEYKLRFSKILEYKESFLFFIDKISNNSAVEKLGKEIVLEKAIKNDVVEDKPFRRTNLIEFGDLR